jgi:hypothetical protein
MKRVEEQTTEIHSTPNILDHYSKLKTKRMEKSP